MERYLERLGFTAALPANASTLRALQERHLLAVPFENLDIHLGRPIDLDPAHAIAKIVDRHRGGFCYELNGAFAALLTHLGFRVTLLSARVFDSNGIPGPEFDHLALRVDLDDPWIVDVGFGDSFRVPLLLQEGVLQNDGWADYRVEQRAGRVVVSRLEQGRWRDQYGLSLEPRAIEEFSAMCLFHQTSPDSHFTRKRICTLATTEGRVTLSGLKRIRTLRDSREERELTSEWEWREVLREEFGVVL